MESCSLRSPTLTSISTSSLSKNGLFEKPSGYSKFLRVPSSKNNYPFSRKLKFLNVKAQSSGTMKVSSEATGATPKEADSKDNDLVFVAGATGRVGSRTVRELLKLGFRVRVGVRSTQRAESLVQSVKQMNIDSSEGTRPVEMLEIVECDLEKPDRILPALGNASVVICCIGASEKEIFDITGPYRIDYLATKNLVDAATVAKVNHFIMVSSLGTNKVGFPAAILNLFWGVLIWKRQAEVALIASGIPYTIVRPGGMERPTDAYKETHNITLSGEDTLFGGQVSNLQVAELMACMAKNRSLSYCKVVEVIAETTAPLTPMEELLAKIPSQRVEPEDSIPKDGPAPTPPKSVVSAELSAPAEKESEQPKEIVTRPLSPYTAYEDLKPPSSPSPTQSITPVAAKTNDLDGAPPPSSIPSPSAEPSVITIKDETEQEGMKKPRPLSPYTAYDDLKPPTSPSPTPPVVHKDLTIANELPNLVNSDTETCTSDMPTDITEAVAALEAALKTRPLSPYTAYEDLKPPSSPSPTASGHKEVVVTNASEQGEAISSGNDMANTPVTSVTEKDLPQKPSHHSSPFYMYEDMKPPTSPMPSAPRIS